MLHSASPPSSMPHSTSPPMPSTPPQQFRQSRQQFPIGSSQYSPAMQSFDQRAMAPRAQAQQSPWPQGQQTQHQNQQQTSPVHPSYILTSNSRPTSAPMRIDGEMSDGMSSPSSALPLTPNTWGSYPGSEEAAHAATGMWGRMGMMPTSHPSVSSHMEKPGYASSLPGSLDEQQFQHHPHTHHHHHHGGSGYDMFSSPMMPVRDRHWYADEQAGNHSHMLSAGPQSSTSAPGQQPRSSPFYAASAAAATLSPPWSHDIHDGVSIVHSEPSRCDSRSPMIHQGVSPMLPFSSPGAANTNGATTSPITNGLEGSLAAVAGKKRKRATNDDPKCRCDICGKHFQRAYNLRAHKETHNPARSQPFACDAEGCKKRFVRKTDLSRHVKSVHVQVREHACDACNARFARKDTMRRHALDGCPARQKTRKRNHKHHQVYFDIVDSPMSGVKMPNMPMEPQALWS